MTTAGMRRGGVVLTVLGLAGLIALYWMCFFWVSTEVNQGVIQRIFYVHVPAAWTSFLAIGFAALASGMYLWLRDDRLDRAALCAAQVLELQLAAGSFFFSNQHGPAGAALPGPFELLTQP